MRIRRKFNMNHTLVLQINKAGSSNKALYFEFCIHASEWLSCANGQNLIHKVRQDPVICDLISSK